MSFKRARTSSNAAAAANREDPDLRHARAEHGMELRQLLLEKFCIEGMSGAEVATIAYYATRAGASGVADLALAPASATKNGHAHVKNHAGAIYPEVDLTFVQVPMFTKREARRTVESVPLFLPSKAFEKYLTPNLLQHPLDDFQEVVGQLDGYLNHPVVQAAKAEGLESLVRPIAVYWDGVAYTKNDSFWAFYCTDILTRQKFLSFLLRSEEMCQCGCRGWCSLFPLLEAWATDLKALSAASPVRFAVMDIQGDWPAFLQIFGLRYWSHNVHPCPLCRVNQMQLKELCVSKVTLDTLPYEEYSTNDYMHDLKNSVQVVEILSPELRTTVYQALGYRKKFRGRVVLRDVPELGLKKHSRLMPSSTLRDVSMFEFTEVPFVTLWWIASPDHAKLLHDCPLFEVPGISLEAWSLDLMHAWHLGPVQTLVSMGINFCLDTGLWSPKTDIDALEKRKLGMLALRAELFQWYRDQRQDPEWKQKGTEAPRPITFCNRISFK